MTAHSALAPQEWWRPVAAPAPLETADASGPSQRSLTAFRALMSFMFFLLIAPQSFVPGLGALHLAAVAAGVASTAHLASAFQHGHSVFGTHPSAGWAGALAGWALITAPFSYWPGGTLTLLFGLYFKSLVIFWLLSVVVDTPRRLKQLVTWLTLLTIPISGTAIMHFISGTFIEGGDAATPRIMGYDAALTANPNDLALVLCMMLPLAAALAAAERRVLFRMMFVAIAALDVVAVIITFSRTGFLTLAVLAVVAMFTFTRGRARLWSLGFLGFALVLIPLLPAGYTQHMATITTIESDPTGSAQDRWSDMRTSVDLVLASPIVGAGAGMSILALNEARGPSWVPVHNVYLQYATDLGLPGLSFFLLLLASCVRGVWKIVRDAARAAVAWDFRCLAHGVQMTLVAFVVAGFFHPAAYHFHFYYAAGLSAALTAVWKTAYA